MTVKYRGFWQFDNDSERDNTGTNNGLAIGDISWNTTNERWEVCQTAAAATSTWLPASGMGGEDLAATLVLGNITGGTNIIVSSGDAITGIDSAVAAGSPVTVRAGDYSGAGAFDGGDLTISAGDSAGTGDGGDLTLSAGTGATDGTVVFPTAAMNWSDPAASWIIGDGTGDPNFIIGYAVATELTYRNTGLGAANRTWGQGVNSSDNWRVRRYTGGGNFDTLQLVSSGGFAGSVYLAEPNAILAVGRGTATSGDDYLVSLCKGTVAERGQFHLKVGNHATIGTRWSFDTLPTSLNLEFGRWNGGAILGVPLEFDWNTGDITIGETGGSSNTTRGDWAPATDSTDDLGADALRYANFYVDAQEVTDNITFNEQAGSPAPGAGDGAVWVRNDAPNVLMFTDDAGTDWVLNQTATLQNLADTLSTGNTTGGTDIEISNGDALVWDGGSGEDSVDNVATTNATPATLATLYTLADGEIVNVRARIICSGPTNADKAVFTLERTFGRNTTTSLLNTQVNSSQLFGALTTASATVTFSGNSVIIQVTGEAASNISWRAKWDFVAA